MGKNSFLYIEKHPLRWDEAELDADFMHCRDISSLAQVSPFIQEFTQEGDVILDPFCGMGTTLIAAGLLGRKSVGIELEEARFEMLKSHLAKYAPKLKFQPELVCGDALQVRYPSEVDAVVTNFPYFNGRISNTAGSLYAENNYQSYLEFIEKAIAKSCAALKAGGYMLVFTENIRALNGNMIPQAYDICKILQKYFNLKDERMVIYEKDETEETDEALTNRAHEYVYIAKKRSRQLELGEFERVLKHLCAECDVCLMGTMALHYLCPELLDDCPQDADLLTEFSLENIRKIIGILTSEGYEVYSWQDRIDEQVSEALLRGRKYIRGQKRIGDNLYSIDVTYELRCFSYQELKRDAVKISNIDVFTKASLLKILSLCHKKKHAVQKERLERWNEC